MSINKRFRPTLREYRIQELISLAATQFAQERYKEARMWQRCTMYSIIALNFVFCAQLAINSYYGV